MGNRQHVLRLEAVLLRKQFVRRVKFFFTVSQFVDDGGRHKYGNEER